MIHILNIHYLHTILTLLATIDKKYKMPFWSFIKIKNNEKGV